MVNGVSGSTVQSATALLNATGGALMRRELNREADQAQQILSGIVQSPTASAPGQGERVDVYA
ncbi:MAG: hypothetical protein VKP72_03235 [bacterium]|nr:hypothetical protein [bacterium]